MTLNPAPGEIDEANLTRTLSRRDALDRVSSIYTESGAQRLYDAAQDGNDTDLTTAIQDRANQFGWNLTPGGTGREAGKARTLLTELLNVAVSAPNRAADAETFDGSRYTQDAITTERRNRVTATMTQLGAQVASIITGIQTLTDKADARAAAVRPALDLNDPNQLTRTAQAWEYTIQAVLERDGATNWTRLIESLDLDGLFALQRFAPSWLATQPNTRALESSRDQILEGIERRIPHVLTDPNLVALLTNARQCHEALDYANDLSDALSIVKTASDARSITGKVQRISVAAGMPTEIHYPADSTYKKL